MASILELGVNTGKWDSGLKKAKSALDNFIQANGGLSQALEKESGKMSKFVGMMGKMESTAKTTKGQMADYKSAIERLTMQYNKMSEAQKKTIGQDYLRSIEQLKQKYRETSDEAKRFNAELQGGKGGMSGLNSVLGELGSKFGLSGELTGALTSGTLGLTAAVTAGAAAVGTAAKAWADYNSEMAKNLNSTSVITGLQGSAAEEMTVGVKALVRTYDIDFRETVNAANTLMTQFGVSGEHAVDLIRDGMRGMLDGDGPKLLSMIQQYAPAFRDAGIEASQLIAVIHNSEGGLFTDQNMNAIVMGIKNIRLMTDQTSDALAKLGINGEEMTQKLNEGSMTIFDALKQVSEQLENTSSSSQAAGEVMQQVFGKQGTAAGSKLGEAIATLNLNLEETKMQTGEVGEGFDQLVEANRELEQAMYDCFGYKGWQELANGIKTELIGALTFTIETINEAKNALRSLWSMFSGGGSSGGSSGGSPKPGGSGGTYSGDVYVETTDSQGNVLKATHNGIDVTDQVNGVVITGRSRPKASGSGSGRRTGGRRTGGGSTGGGRGTHQKTDAEKAADSVEAALKNYKDAIATATMRFEAGMDNSEDMQKRELAARERLTMAYVDAYNLVGNEAYKESFEKSAVEFNNLADVVKGKRKEFENSTQSLMGMSVNSFDSKLSGLLSEDMGTFAKRKGINIDTSKMTKGAKEVKEGWEDAARAVLSVGDALQQIEDPGAKVAGIIGQAIANIALGFAQATAAASGGGPFAWIAAIAGGLGTMLSTIAAIKSATAGSYAEGGIVPGNNYNDGLVANVSSGELILNRAQQSNIAAQLSGTSEAGTSQPYLDVETIWLGIGHYLKRKGMGEIVTTR